MAEGELCLTIDQLNERIAKLENKQEPSLSPQKSSSSNETTPSTMVEEEARLLVLAETHAHSHDHASLTHTVSAERNADHCDHCGDVAAGRDESLCKQGIIQHKENSALIESATAENMILASERDAALAKNMILIGERDAAVAERDVARRERDTAAVSWVDLRLLVKSLEGKHGGIHMPQLRTGQ
jgi:hypothetical protein